MTTAEIADALREWFTAARAANMKIPTGWFGRPYDNQYYLRSATADGECLTITLSEDHTVIVDRPTVLENAPGRFAVGGFDHASHDWRESGTTIAHHDTFTDGWFEFLALG